MKKLQAPSFDLARLKLESLFDKLVNEVQNASGPENTLFEDTAVNLRGPWVFELEESIKLAHESLAMK